MLLIEWVLPTALVGAAATVLTVKGESIKGKYLQLHQEELARIKREREAKSAEEAKREEKRRQEREERHRRDLEEREERLQREREERERNREEVMVSAQNPYSNEQRSNEEVSYGELECDEVL